MTVGIYQLSWNEEDSLVYIGQSINIEYRYKQHSSALEGNIHSNYKLQEMYNKYVTLPNLSIIEECVASDLDILEISWTKEFDSINNGLNIISAGSGGGRGLTHSGSKYTKFQILKVFSLLYKTVLTYEQVANKARLSKYLVHNIAGGNHHLWLKEFFPEQFQLMLSNKVVRSKLNVRSSEREGLIHPKLVSPEGEVFTVNNIRDFCKNHSVLSTWCTSTPSSIAKVLKGTKASHKGWTAMINNQSIV